LPSLKEYGWALFDQIVAEAPFAGVNPWGNGVYQPDYDALGRLLGVPLALRASSQSGVPALAFDVWIAYELRRAGFHPDRVWPRATPPRVLPAAVSALIDSLPQALRASVEGRLARGLSGGTTGSVANLLGKNYVKQVDVVMSTWQTGPELMISTKRMDSSFGKNAANRVEESYGDAKNLSLRHPQAALGFFYSLRSTAFATERDIAIWLLDLLTKLGREEDAYDAVGLVIPEWGLPPADNDDADEDATALTIDDLLDPPESNAPAPADVTLNDLPSVTLRHDLVPEQLSPSRFFTVIIDTVLGNSPINFHAEARQRRADAQ